MEQLLEQYKETRESLIKAKETIAKQRDHQVSRRDMLKELEEKRLQNMAKLTLPTTLHDERAELESEISKLKDQIDLLSGMISDRDHDIEWMETGRRPGNKRGVERLAAYQRERPVDPVKMQAYIAKTSSGGSVQAHTLTDTEQERIEFALGQLSARERECYEMIRGNGLPYSEAAEILGVEKGTVQWNVESADTKLRHHVNQADLFDYL